jgi:hypothetical protein
MSKLAPKKSVKSPAAKAASEKSEVVQASPVAKSAAPVVTPKPVLAAIAPAPTAAAPKTVKAVFTLKAPAAKQVQVCGEFNGWQPGAAPLTRQADGTWETSIALRPGRYQYKFVVDGNWIHDLNAKINVPNEHHSLNSVIEVLA